MKKAFLITAILSLFLLGCASQQGTGAVSDYSCIGYYSIFRLEGEGQALDGIYSKLRQENAQIISYSLMQQEFEKSAVECYAPEEKSRPLTEQTSYCFYSEGGFDYKKDYRHVRFEEGKYSFSIYEECGGKLKVRLDYNGECAEQERIRGEAGIILEKAGVKSTPQYSLIKNLE